MGFINFFKLLRFMNKIRKNNVFSQDNYYGFLEVMVAFLETKCNKKFECTLIMNRSFEDSVRLLDCLVSKYKLTKSDVILNQIIAVISEEVIKRGV